MNAFVRYEHTAFSSHGGDERRRPAVLVNDHDRQIANQFVASDRVNPALAV